APPRRRRPGSRARGTPPGNRTPHRTSASRTTRPGTRRTTAPTTVPTPRATRRTRTPTRRTRTTTRRRRRPMRSPKLAALELRRFGRGKLPRAALVALMVLPLLYGALYLWSFWDPYDRLDRIPVALVNEDKGATADGKRITAGDDITEGLRDSSTFDWREVSAQEARRGVEDGTYYLSLTMPADFSRRIASSSGDAPETGALQVRTNDANNYIVGQISRTVFGEVRQAASAKTSRSFLEKFLVSYSDIHGRTEEAAKGADRLKGGIGKAEKGSKDLAGHLTNAKQVSGKLSKGLVDLHKGAGSLKD